MFLKIHKKLSDLSCHLVHVFVQYTRTITSWFATKRVCLFFFLFAFMLYVTISQHFFSHVETILMFYLINFRNGHKRKENSSVSCPNAREFIRAEPETSVIMTLKC